MPKGNDRFTCRVFPNPAGNEININLSDIAGQGYVELTDITGRTVISRKVTGTHTLTLSLNGLSDGMYLVKFRDDIHTETIKINKRR